MIGILIITLTALVAGAVLSFFNADNEDYTAEIEKRLPGLNCGACGFAGCKGMAQEVVKNPESYKKCRLLRKEKLEEFERYMKEKGLIK